VREGDQQGGDGLSVAEPSERCRSLIFRARKKASRVARKAATPAITGEMNAGSSTLAMMFG
jgi:hypothetical protein